MMLISMSHCHSVRCRVYNVLWVYLVAVVVAAVVALHHRLQLLV